MLYSILEVVMKSVGYLLFIYGLWLFFQDYLVKQFVSNYRNWKRKRQIKRIEELQVEGNHKKNRKSNLHEHIELVISSVSNKKDVSVINFYVFSILSFLVVTIVLFMLIKEIIISLFIGIFAGIFPYIVLRFRLFTKRVHTSYQFLISFQVVLQNYQATGRDIYYTIQNVVKELDDKQLQKVFRNLFSAIQKDRGEEDFKKAVKVFAFSINSTFSKRFAKLITKAFLEGKDISQALIDLNHDMNKRKMDIQKEKTEKLETIFLGYMPVLVFPLMFFMVYRFTGVIDFWYVFQMKLPLILFVISLVMTILSALMAYVLSKPRGDI